MIPDAGDVVDTTLLQAESTKHQCARFQQNGERVVELREQPQVELWVQFNLDFRPDAALFVDGECRGQGAYTKAECDALSASIQKSTVVPKQADLFD